MAVSSILKSAPLMRRRSQSVRVRAPKATTSVRMTVQFSPFSASAPPTRSAAVASAPLLAWT
jgi:hypothetical protein